MRTDAGGCPRWPRKGVVLPRRRGPTRCVPSSCRPTCATAGSSGGWRRTGASPGSTEPSTPAASNGWFPAPGSRRRWPPATWSPSNWTPPIRNWRGSSRRRPIPRAQRVAAQSSTAHRAAGHPQLPSRRADGPDAAHAAAGHAQPVGSAARRLPSGAGRGRGAVGPGPQPGNRSWRSRRPRRNWRPDAGQRGRRARDPGAQRAGPGIGESRPLLARMLEAWAQAMRRRWTATRSGAAAWTRRPSAASSSR